MVNGGIGVVPVWQETGNTNYINREYCDQFLRSGEAELGGQSDASAAVSRRYTAITSHHGQEPSLFIRPRWGQVDVIPE